MKRIQVLVGLTALIGSLYGTVVKAAETYVTVTDDFEAGMHDWTTSDPDSANAVWKIESVNINGKPSHALRVTGTSKYQPPFRSPHSIALLKDAVVSNFELNVRMQNTDVASGDHRDLCVFWGYQDPAHFYYVHLGAKPDPHSCQIFIVNGAARTKITTREAESTPWTEGWHQVKVVRNVEDGTMKVYFDDMATPLMEAHDSTFASGQVGLGTFDNHGNFDDFALEGKIATAHSTDATR